MRESLSTSNFDMSWYRFSMTFVLTCVVALVVLYTSILVIDPYDSLAFSPDWERYPVSRHSRDFNAILARRPEYDSAVIGNSTSMLLHPDELNREFGGKFVMLSMPAASPFEQMELLRLFQRHHPSMRTLLIGLDSIWCHADGASRFLGLMVNQQFPHWLYDENPWNDLLPLDETTLKKARMQLRALLGVRIRYEYKPDGYWDFSDALHDKNDPESIRERLYNEDKRLLRLSQDNRTATYPDMEVLEEALAKLPAETNKILFSPPSHHRQLPEPNTAQMAAWEGCKRRAAAIADKVPQTMVVDFNIRSRITEDDGNFIDGHHYTRPIASELVRFLSAAWQSKAQGLPELRVLAQPDR